MRVSTEQQHLLNHLKSVKKLLVLLQTSDTDSCDQNLEPESHESLSTMSTFTDLNKILTALPHSGPYETTFNMLAHTHTHYDLFVTDHDRQNRTDSCRQQSVFGWKDIGRLCADLER